MVVLVFVNKTLQQTISQSGPVASDGVASVGSEIGGEVGEG